MKIRIKFAKTGVMKFVGHLDVMRYFQKVMRRAEVDIRYSDRLFRGLQPAHAAVVCFSARCRHQQHR